MTSNKEMINSEEFNNALLEGVEYKKTIVTSYKTQNKTNLERFQEVMIESNNEIQEILAKKGKNKTDADKQKLKDYKKFINTLYKQTQDLTVKEKLEEGQKSKVQKIVEKIVPVIDMLVYIGDTKLTDEFAKHGIQIVSSSSLEKKIPALADESKKTVMKEIFTDATSIRQKMIDDNDKIVTEVYSTKVPVELQYDKKTNNAGLKQNDFMKLVDLKTKLVMAASDEAKEKVDEAIEHIASEKQFEAARAEMIRDKLSSL